MSSALISTALLTILYKNVNFDSFLLCVKVLNSGFLSYYAFEIAYYAFEQCSKIVFIMLQLCLVVCPKIENCILIALLEYLIHLQYCPEVMLHLHTCVACC